MKLLLIAVISLVIGSALLVFRNRNLRKNLQDLRSNVQREDQERHTITTFSRQDQLMDEYYRNIVRLLHAAIIDGGKPVKIELVPAMVQSLDALHLGQLLIEVRRFGAGHGLKSVELNREFGKPSLRLTWE